MHDEDDDYIQHVHDNITILLSLFSITKRLCLRVRTEFRNYVFVNRYIR